MHAEAGDTIEVWLRNMLPGPINLEPLGTAWNIEGTLGPVGSGLTAMFLIRVSVGLCGAMGSCGASTAAWAERWTGWAAGMAAHGLQLG